MGSLSSGGAGASSSPTQKLANDLERAKGSASGLKKEIQSIGTAAAQGFKESGYGKSTVDFLKNLSDAKRAMVLSANPDLNKIWEAQLSGGSAGSSKLKSKLKGDMKEAMDDLARHGNSQKIVDHIAQIAMGDAALNNYKGKTPPVIPTIDKKGVAMGVLASLFNPFVGARMLSQAVPKSGGGSGGANSLFGAAGAMGYGEFFIVAKLLKFAFEQLIKVVNEVFAAFDRARQLYAKSLMSGLGLESTGRRSMLASIIGVSEKDVFQFGSAMAYLSPRIQNASKIAAETAIPLTEVSYEFKILKLDMEALFNVLANDASGSIKTFVQAIDLITVSITNLINSPAFKFLAGSAIKGVAGAILPNWLTGLFNSGAAQAGINSAVGGGGKLGLPESHMRQLPASSWERMGLVIGGGMGQNYAKDTAKNTKEIADGIKKITGNMSRRNIPSGFGMDSATANP